MKKRIELDNKEFEYSLRRIRRSRRVRISIHSDGTLVVSAPRAMSERSIKHLIFQKSQWVIEKLEYFKNNPQRVSPKGTKEDYLAHKNEAFILAQKRIEHFNHVYGFAFKTISIRNQKTRWGSCSRKGNLSFNYKIATLPERLADYIIVHELCHLREFNHSRKFWDLVARVLPDYVERRKELKKGGIGIA